MSRKRIVFLALLLTALSAYGGRPLLYVWQGWNDKTTAESLACDFARWKSYGVDGVCFNAGFDLQKIRSAAQIAHRCGLEYHAWTPCMLQQGLPHDWYAVNRLGQPADTYPAYVDYYKALDPHNPEVQAWFVKNFTEIAQISEVDYIQLDYIRYPDVVLAEGLWDKYGLVMNGEYPAADYCYCDSCTSDFQRRSGIDIRKVIDPSKISSWSQFRQDIITSLVNKIANAVHGQGKKVSADVFPGPDSYARSMVRQQWNAWNVDMLFPMNYNDFYLQPATWVGKITKEEVRAVRKNKTPIISGLFICKDWQRKQSIIDPEGSGLIPSEISTAVKGALKAGATGISLFTPESMTPEHWAALKQALKSEKQ